MGGLILHTILPHPEDAKQMWIGMSSVGVFHTADGGASLSARSVLADVAWLKVRRGSSSIGDLLAVAADSPPLASAATNSQRPKTPSLSLSNF